MRMGLTRKETIILHRKMWNWIAERIEEYKVIICIEEFKEIYLDNEGYDIEADCFLCEYASKNSLNCTECILMWGKEVTDRCCFTNTGRNGLYSKVRKAETWEEQAVLARRIANLPERTVE